MKKILPINEDPYIRTYTFHGFLHAIVATKEKVNFDVANSVAEVIVDQYEKYDWEIDNDKLTFDVAEGNKLSFFANKWNYGMNVGFCRKCQKTDEISITVNKQLYSNAWSAISIFMVKDNVKSYRELEQYPIVVGHFEKDGMFYSVKSGIHERIKSNMNKPLKMRLIREDNRIFIQYEDDSYVSEKICICELTGEDDWKIGFGINLGNSMYFEWLFSNYIQIFSIKDGWMPLDYLVNVHKNWSTYTTNALIDYSYCFLNELEIFGYSELQYIKKQLVLGKYVEVHINDKLHDKNANQAEPFFHPNLIYGFDDEKEVLYMLYYQMGKLVPVMMSYAEYESEGNQNKTRKIYSLQYNPSYERFHLSTKRLALMYSDYLNGDNNALYESYLEEDGVYGLNCYEKIICQENMEYVSSDVRIPHLLLEHTECNIDRVNYLLVCNKITEEAYAKLNDYLQEEKKNLLAARNLCLKALMIGKCSTDELYEYLSKAVRCERQFVEEMLKQLLA